ncbi:MAG: proline iminopeptidase [Alteromonadaceae bacterium]|jgi:proline iminopeptidase
MRGIYPLIQPNQTYRFNRGDEHQLYVEESGTLEGIPVLFCHGGPGGGSNPIHRCFYDPEFYRIIIFDQRGCGLSTPHASLESNDTWSLLEDIEFIREQLNVDKWVVAGGSWGSTLALIYAINYPQRVSALLLRGVFLARQSDYDWLYSQSGGASQIFPDYYRDFIEVVSGVAEGEEIAAYYRLLTSNNEIERLHAAKVWAVWEGKISTLKTKADAQSHCSQTHTALSLSRIECHYFYNRCFIDDNYILDNISKIADIPGYIIHGRYDVVCKIENAFTLQEYWPNAQLQVIPAAGHSGLEPAVADALCRASDAMAVFLTKQNEPL